MTILLQYIQYILDQKFSSFDDSGHEIHYEEDILSQTWIQHQLISVVSFWRWLCDGTHNESESLVG